MRRSVLCPSREWQGRMCSSAHHLLDRGQEYSGIQMLRQPQEPILLDECGAARTGNIPREENYPLAEAWTVTGQGPIQGRSIHVGPVQVTEGKIIPLRLEVGEHLGSIHDDRD